MFLFEERGSSAGRVGTLHVHFLHRNHRSLPRHGHGPGAPHALRTRSGVDGQRRPSGPGLGVKPAGDRGGTPLVGRGPRYGVL